MLLYQIFLAVFALSIPILTLVVAGRLGWCAWQSVRTAQLKLAALAVLGVACLAGVLAAVGFVWFGYGVAHSRKDYWTDLRVILMTGLPFYGASFGLWRMARYLRAAIRTRGAERPIVG